MSDSDTATEAHTDPVVTHDPEPAPDPVTAKQLMRAFEDKHFGENTSRINGEIERGIGSPYANMTPYQKREHDALERLIAAEQRLADASAELAGAEAAHEAAIKQVEALEAAVSEDGDQ